MKGKRKKRETHHLIMLITELLAHQLAHPVVAAVSILGLQTGDYERHFESGNRCRKGSLKQ